MSQGKRSLIGLLILFVAPIILGTVVYFNKEKLNMGGKTVNYGDLVRPAKPIEVLDLLQQGKTASAPDVLRGKWTMLLIAPSECSSLCQQHLLFMKRVRTLMNEHMRRIRTTLVTSDDGAIDLATIKTDYPDLILTHTKAAKSAFSDQFNQSVPATIFLLDPLGNLMMAYPQADPNAKRVIKDLKRLLKYSRLG